MLWVMINEVKNIIAKSFSNFIIMKKIFFLLLLLPVTSMAQKNYPHNDSSCKRILNRLDSNNACINKCNSIMSVMNTGWINIEYPFNGGAIIYPNVEDMYKWTWEWDRALKGILIPYR